MKPFIFTEPRVLLILWLILLSLLVFGSDMADDSRLSVIALLVGIPVVGLIRHLMKRKPNG